MTGYEPLVEQMTNDPKDRHVLAAAVKSGATVPWGIEIRGPSTFLKYQYDLNPSVVVDKLHAQAHNLGRTLAEQLAVLRPAALDLGQHNLVIRSAKGGDISRTNAARIVQTASEQSLELAHPTSVGETPPSRRRRTVNTRSSGRQKHGDADASPNGHL